METEKSGVQLSMELMATDTIALQEEIQSIYNNYEALKKFALQNCITILQSLKACDWQCYPSDR